MTRFITMPMTLRICQGPLNARLGLMPSVLLRKSLSSDTKGVTELFGVPSVTARDFPTRIRISKPGIYSEFA